MKKIFYLLIIIVLMFTVTACTKEKEEVKEETPVVENTKSKNITIVDDEYITIKFLKREHKKVPGMLNNKGTTFNLPTLLFNITNKLNEKIHFEVRATTEIGADLGYYYSLTNETRNIDSSGTVIQPKKSLDVNVIYEQSRDLEQEYPLSVFDNKKVYLRLYKTGENNGYNFVKEYELDGSVLE